MQATITTEALRYREELNLGVFPVDPESKKPRITTWQRGGLRSRHRIEQVFGRNPDAAVGIPGGQMLNLEEQDMIVLENGIPTQLGRYVLQLDVDERNYGIEALSELPKMPRTATAKTPNGYHFWFWSRQPVAAFTRPDGLEIKGLGAFTIEPPAPERAWTRNPFDFPIAEVPDFLIERAQGDAVLQRDPSTLEWALDFGDPLELIRSARPGSRRPTLLRQAGRVNHHLVWKGLLDERVAKEQLRAAAEENGTDQREIERILEYVFNSPPYTPGSSSSRGGVLLTVVVTLSDSEEAVLGAVCSAYEKELSQGVPLPEIKRKLTALSWLGERSGLKRKEQVRRCLRKLERHGLIWFSGSAYLRGQVPGKTRPAHFWRPTFAGLALRFMYTNHEPREG